MLFFDFGASGFFAELFEEFLPETAFFEDFVPAVFLLTVLDFEAEFPEAFEFFAVFETFEVLEVFEAFEVFVSLSVLEEDELSDTDEVVVFASEDVVLLSPSAGAAPHEAINKAIKALAPSK